MISIFLQSEYFCKECVCKGYKHSLLYATMDGESSNGGPQLFFCAFFLVHKLFLEHELYV